MRVQNVKKTDAKNTPDQNKNKNEFNRKRDSEAGNMSFKKILEKELEK